MKIKCIETGSKGNFYIISNNKGEILLLELGIPYEKILSNIEDIGKIQGVLVSHKHKDHNFNDNVKKFVNASINVLYPEFENCIVGKKYKMGNFEIIPFPCKHNVVCYGYLIKCDNKIIMFATDTKELPKFNISINVFLVEINHISNWVEKILFEMDADDTKLYYESRVLITHHSVENAKEYFENLKYKPQCILGIHKSTNIEHFSSEYALEELKDIADYIDIVSDGDEYEF